MNIVNSQRHVLDLKQNIIWANKRRLLKLIKVENERGISEKPLIASFFSLRQSSSYDKVSVYIFNF